MATPAAESAHHCVLSGYHPSQASSLGTKVFCRGLGVASLGRGWPAGLGWAGMEPGIQGAAGGQRYGHTAFPTGLTAGQDPRAHSVLESQ